MNWHIQWPVEPLFRLYSGFCVQVRVVGMMDFEGNLAG